MLFWLSETGQIWGFQAFWWCSVDFPHSGDPLAEIGHIWGFWALSGERVGVNVEGRAEAYFRRQVLSRLHVEFILQYHKHIGSNDYLKKQVSIASSMNNDKAYSTTGLGKLS